MKKSLNCRMCECPLSRVCGKGSLLSNATSETEAIFPPSLRMSNLRPPIAPGSCRPGSPRKNGVWPKAQGYSGHQKKEPTHSKPPFLASKMSTK
ncbi:hypothetical protein CEXT_283221 [Caerostris extrusa]|uniref:Uncharacterized protein n=1 Tax=Caerostris extrusa TaxID=172846 RepID=A0AAV4Q4F4_CAEEX|nr:hypothetical protein CEXT_283221 [Caerostris extrusa]